MASRDTPYIGALDGLRGVAALVVVFAHTSAGLRMPKATRESFFEGPFFPLVNADGAVQLFFVLSGFVLAGSLARNRTRSDLAAYGVKRVFRIHPPYVVAVLFAWGMSFFYQVTNLTPFLDRYARVHLDPSQLPIALRFPGSAFKQLPVGWSLEAEMVFSFLLPVMIFVMRRSHPALLMVGSAGLLWADQPLRYALPFALGLLAYEHRESIERWVSRLPGPIAFIALATSIVVWSSPWTLGLRELSATHHQPIVVTCYGFGSLALMSLVAYRPGLNRLFSLPPVAWVGRVSYSLYLVHFTVILMLAPYLGGDLSWGVGVRLYAGVLVASLAISAICHAYVEAPSIRVGNLICGWIQARFGGAGVRSERARSEVGSG